LEQKSIADQIELNAKLRIGWFDGCIGWNRNGTTEGWAHNCEKKYLNLKN
jgi:hypothetical protein